LKVKYWRGDWGCFWLGGAQVLEFQLHVMTSHRQFDNLKYAIRVAENANG
jgi:hypothetical protein